MHPPLIAEKDQNGDWWLLRDYQPCPLAIANFHGFETVCKAAAEYLNRDDDWLVKEFELSQPNEDAPQKGVPCK